MVKLCSKCFEIHMKGWRRKRACVICHQRLFECDEFFAPIIRDLNLKGYRTMYSCSGHIPLPVIFNFEHPQPLEEPEAWRCYIMFDHGVEIPVEPPAIFNFTRDAGLHNSQCSVERVILFPEGTNYQTVVGRIAGAWQDVMTWVDSLPDIREIKPVPRSETVRVKRNIRRSQAKQAASEYSKHIREMEARGAERNAGKRFRG